MPASDGGTGHRCTITPGAFRGRTKLSKRGNARLRRTLRMAAQVAIRQRENSFRRKFDRYVEQFGRYSPVSATQLGDHRTDGELDDLMVE